MIEQPPELIEAMKDTMERELESRIKDAREKTGWSQFYLIFSMKPDIANPKVIRQGWVASEYKPPNIAGCLVFYIDWARGILTCDSIVKSQISDADRVLIAKCAKLNFKN